MAFNMTSFFTGVGTVFAAIAVGFGGGAMLTSTPKVELNKLERAAVSTPAPPLVVAVKAPTPEVPSTSTAMAPAAQPAVASNDTPASPPAPDRSISLTPTPASQAAPPQPALVVAKDDAASQPNTAKKSQDGEPGKEAAAKKPERHAERHHERRRRQDVDSAANAVRQMQRDEGQPIRQFQRDDGQQEVVVRRYDSPRYENSRFGFFGDD